MGCLWLLGKHKHCISCKNYANQISWISLSQTGLCKAKKMNFEVLNLPFPTSIALLLNHMWITCSFSSWNMQIFHGIGSSSKGYYQLFSVNGYYQWQFELSWVALRRGEGQSETGSCLFPVMKEVQGRGGGGGEKCPDTPPGNQNWIWEPSHNVPVFHFFGKDSLKNSKTCSHSNIPWSQTLFSCIPDLWPRTLFHFSNSH